MSKALDRALSRFSGGAPDKSEVVVGGGGLRAKEYLPSREVASRLARLQGTAQTREQGLSLQRQFQDGISDEDLAAYGLTRIKRKSPSLVQRGGGALFGALDILDRPSQAVIRGFGGLSAKGGDNPFSGFFGGLTGRGERLSFTDALGFKESTPGKSLIDLVGTVATDPLTYVTFGASAAAKRALLTVSEELGQEVAEQVARRGLGALKEADVIAMAAKGNGRAAKTAGDDLMGTLLKMDEFADGQLDAIADGIRGGLKVGSPFRAGKTAIPGERFRAPLRGSTAAGRRRALMDPIRPGVRSGSILKGTESAIEAPIRAAIRANPGVRGARKAFQVAGNAGSALGRSITGRLGGAAGRAQAAVGNVEEVVAQNAEVLRKADIDEDLKVRIMAASERSAKPNPDGVQLDMFNVESETLGDIFAEHAMANTWESEKIARVIDAVSNTRTRSREARMTPTGRREAVSDAKMRWGTSEPGGPPNPHRIRTLPDVEPTTKTGRRRKLKPEGERVDSAGNTILDAVSYKRAKGLYRDQHLTAQQAAKVEVIELESEYSRIMGGYDAVAAPPEHTFRKNIHGEKVRGPKLVTDPSLGGEYDWWWDLDRLEKDALKRDGRVVTREGTKRKLKKERLDKYAGDSAPDAIDLAPTKGGHVSNADAAKTKQGAEPSVVAEAVIDAMGLPQGADGMEAWLKLTRDIRDAKARARAAPLGATYEEFNDDIAREMLGNEADEALYETSKERLQLELGPPAVHGRNVWDMEFDDVLDEMSELEDTLKGVTPIDDGAGFGPSYPPEFQKAADRYREVYGAFDPNASSIEWEAAHGRMKVLASQTSKRARLAAATARASAGTASHNTRFRTIGTDGQRAAREGPIPGTQVPDPPVGRPVIDTSHGRFSEGRYATRDNDGVVGAANESFKGMPDVVPREMTLEGRRAVKGNSTLKARVDALPPKPINELNKQIKDEIPGLDKIDEFFETDPFKIAQIQYIHNSRQLARKQYLDELETIGDPSLRSIQYPDGEPLVKLNRGSVDEAILEGPGDVKRIKMTMDGQEVWVHPELEPIVKRMDEQFFNPEVQGKFVQAFDDILGMWKGLATVPIWFGIGFHARNMMGNIRLNSIEGVKPGSYRDALAAQKIIEKAVQRSKKASLMDDSSIQAIIKGTDDAALKKSRLSSAFDSGNRMGFEDALWEVAVEEGASDELIGRILSARREGVLNSGFFDADLRGRDFLANLRGADRQTKWEYIKAQLTNPRESVPIKQGAAIGGMVENNARLAHYFSKLDEGLTVSDATFSVKRSLFDYSELTDVEKNVMKRIVPFYTFMRKNTPVQLASLMTTPRKFLTERRLLEGIASTEQGDERATPDWALDGGMVPLPGFMANFLAGGNAAVMGSLDLPTDAAFETIEPLLEFVAWALPDAVIPEEFQASRKEFFSGIVGLPGGGVTEGVKLFLEEATETDLFTGAPLADQGKRQLFERWSNAVPLFSKGRSLLEGVFDVRRTDDPEYVDTVLTIVKNVTGANLAAVGPRRERGEILSRIDELDKVLRRARDAGYDMPTITQMRSAGLLPDAG